MYANFSGKICYFYDVKIKPVGNFLSEGVSGDKKIFAPSGLPASACAGKVRDLLPGAPNIFNRT